MTLFKFVEWDLNNFNKMKAVCAVLIGLLSPRQDVRRYASVFTR